MKKRLSLPILFAALSTVALAQVSVTDGSTYTQNFNTLAYSTSSLVNTAWSNNSTLTGWYLFTPTKSVSGVTSYNAHIGSQNVSGFYSYGSLSSTDRALGALIPTSGTFYDSTIGGVNTPAGYVALALTNNTGSALTGFNLSFSGEQWRLQNNNNNTTYTVPVEYGVGATFAEVTTWNTTPSTFTFGSLFASGTAAGLDGNASANRITGLGGAVDFDWQSGQTLWIRWDFNRIGGASQGVAIDDMSVAVEGFVPTPVPESAVTAVSVGSLALAFALYRRRAVRAQAQA